MGHYFPIRWRLIKRFEIFYDHSKPKFNLRVLNETLIRIVFRCLSSFKKRKTDFEWEASKVHPPSLHICPNWAYSSLILQILGAKF